MEISHKEEIPSEVQLKSFQYNLHLISFVNKLLNLLLRLNCYVL